VTSPLQQAQIFHAAAEAGAALEAAKSFEKRELHGPSGSSTTTTTTSGFRFG
jgi:hypothetical protein